MSVTHGQPGLSSDQRSTIRSAIISARHTLEEELRRQLEKYGIQEESRLRVEDLSHLSADERHTRQTLDAAIERELESTEGDLERSITNYVHEATKTYLNRFIALKAIEVRGLVEETITERPEYGNRSYMHHTVAEIAGELTNAPDDGFGAALELAYQEIGAEIRMIFEESEHTAINLDAQVREEVLDKVDAIDDEAWESDEALGWVYQYFGEEEREDIDQRVDEENYKIGGTDIATKTQLFTPRYIVEWMVDNSLGRTWLEMQGDRTNIDAEENCFYLAPLQESLMDREEKEVKNITVLDPACGSGHMLFYAFDVLYQMYLEEGETPKEYIPREILRNNLYGVDIDSGAAQIAALSLYLKAKNRSPNITIPQLNIVSADAVLINGERKKEILDKANSELEEEILNQIWRSFDNIREWGSLVRIEDKVDELLEDYRDAFESKGQAQFTDDGDLTTQSTFVSGGEEQTWEELKNRLVENVREIASVALEQNDPVEEMFANEVAKTVEILDVLRAEYDVVVSNPPYLYRDKMSNSLKSYIKNNYMGSRDIYAAFIERCSEFAGKNKYVGMVTPENFMFQYSYRKLRKYILSEKYFVEGAHLSRYSFDQAKDSYTIPFILQNSTSTESKPSRFYRLTHEQEEYSDFQDKIKGLADITQSNRRSREHKDIYIVKQNAFLEIDRTPIVYWFGQEVLQLFIDEPTLRDEADVMEGLSTGDDDLYLRNWWEIDSNKVGNQYKWIAKSGDGELYYESYEQAALWESNGQKIRKNDGSHIRNEDYYWKNGITFRDFAKHFTARIHSSDDLFSNKAHFVYTGDKDRDYRVLGYLNSSLSRFIMNGLNPGLNFKSGDGARLPIQPNALEGTDTEELVKSAIAARKQRYKYKETKKDFDFSLYIKKYPDILFEIDYLDAQTDVIHGRIDEIVFESYAMNEVTKERAYDELPDNLYQYPHLSNAGDLVSNEVEVKSEVVPEAEYRDIISQVEDNSDEEIRDMSENAGISPYTIAHIRKNNNLYTSDEKTERTATLLSGFLGCMMGRWELDKLSPVDGILVFDKRFETNIPDLLEKCINIAFDNPKTIEKRIAEDLGRDPIEWLRSRFFRYHHCKEYRRRGQRIPIYWQLESPNGAFSCFIYYHQIDANTLPKLRGQYLDTQLERLENELETLNAQTSGENPDKDLLNRKEEVQSDLEDIQEFRDTIDEMIDDGVTVDVEKGIWENIKEWDQYQVLETGLPKLKSSYSR